LSLAKNVSQYEGGTSLGKLFLLDTGMRIGEAVTVTLDKLELAHHRIVIGLEGKGQRERIGTT
jgi:integrase